MQSKLPGCPIKSVRGLVKYLYVKRVYYIINTNEIPGELSRENMISSHVKRSPLLWLQ